MPPVWPAWALWAAFVVYGSLVPWEWRALPLDEAWLRLRQMPMLQLSVHQRADWIANGVLYLPMGLLGTLALAGGRRQALGPAVLAWLLAMALAVLVEFAQLFFPPRTVSRNDVLAEAIGAGLGALLAVAAAGRLQALLQPVRQALQRGATPAQWSSLGAAYLALLWLLALFPFDLLLSAAEWQARWHGGLVGAWLAPGGAGRAWPLRLGQLLVETLAMLPVGLWLAQRRRPAAGPPRAWPMLLAGAALGLAIELSQLAMASGVSQGASVLTRALGVALGAALLPRLQRLSLAQCRALLRRATVPLLLAHLPLLALAYGWAGLAQADWAGAGARWQALRLLPLYYHYYSTETHALFSVAVAVLAYAPVGVLAWAWRLPRAATAALAALLALGVELGRLLLPDTHPEPTNLLIAAAAAALARALLHGLTGPDGAAAPPPAPHPHPPSPAARPAAAPATVPQAPAAAAVANTATAAAAGTKATAAAAMPPPALQAIARAPASPARWLLPLAVAAGCVFWLLGFPWHPLLLGLLLLAAAALVSWRPVALFVLVPAALPVLDLAPWSGRRFADEFDALLALGLAVAWARLPPAPRAQRPAATASTWALAAVLLVMAIGVARTLWPWPGLALDAFAQPMSPFNALRVAKGALWAGLLYMLGRRLQARGAPVGAAFGWGMSLGLAATVAWVLAERMAFSYLLDFGSQYRISGPFSDMSLGGAYVECYIACALPFLLQRLLPPVPWWRLLPGLALLAGAVYALMVTYSRGGQAAGLLAVLLLVAGQLLAGQGRWLRAASGLAALLLVAVVSWPILGGSFAQQRLAALDADVGIRERHWAAGLSLVDNSPAAQLLGMGAGRFAELWLWRAAATGAKPTASHRLVTLDDGGTALRLSAGYAYFVDQVVTVPAMTELALTLRWRARTDAPMAAASAAAKARPPGAPEVGLCQKWIIASFDCSRARASNTPLEGGWQQLSLRLRAPADGPGRLPRPLRLSLHNGGPLPLDITDVSLLDAQGRQWLANGRFEDGMDHWTFTSDDHLAWHAKSLLVGTYVELGALGTAALLALLLAGTAAALRRLREGWTEGAALLAALGAFATIGLIDTLVDVPRFLLLFMLLCLVPALGPRPGPARGSAPAGLAVDKHA